ncbi:titin-like [Penaeus indicus]|uniref:titin-like n=1 Tax=Penaeus indicus TaxID=29960 RepID=UPI00300CCD07
MRKMEEDLSNLLEKGRTMEQDSEMLNMLATVSGLKTRLKTLRSEAEGKKNDIETKQSESEQQKFHLIEYQQLLQDLECWVTETYSQITADVCLGSVTAIREQITLNQNLQRDLVRRENQLTELRSKCERVQGDAHIQSLAQEMTDHLAFLSQTICDTRLVLQNRLHQLKEILENERKRLPSDSQDSEKESESTIALKQEDQPISVVKEQVQQEADVTTEPETTETTVYKVMRRRSIKNVVMIGGMPVETEEVVEEPTDQATDVEPEGTTTVVRTVRRRSIKSIVMVDGKPIETEEVVEDPISVSEELVEKDNVLLESVYEPDVTAPTREFVPKRMQILKDEGEFLDSAEEVQEPSVAPTITTHQVIRRIVKKIVMIDGKPVEIEELEDPQDISDELMQGNLPVDSVITRTTSDPDLTTTTVRTVVRRRIKKIVMVDGQPVETEEFIEEPVDTTLENLEDYAKQSVIPESSAESEIFTTVRKIIKKRIIKKIVMVDGKPVETEEVVEDPISVSEELVEKDNVLLESVYEPDVTAPTREFVPKRMQILKDEGEFLDSAEEVQEPSVAPTITTHQVIRRIVKKIVMIDGKPVEIEELEDPQDISDELMQGNLPVDSVITRTTSDPDLTTTTVRTVVRRRIKKIVMIDGKPVEIEELEDPQDISDELMQGNLPVDSVITRTTSDPDLTTTTVRTVVRRRIKKIVMIDGKPVEIEELEDPQDISDELMQGNLPVDSVITRTTSDPDLTTTTVRTVVRRRIKKIVMIDGKPVEIEELEDPQDISDELMQGNLPVDSVITRTTSDPDLTTTTVRTVVRRRIKKIVMIDGKPVEIEELEDPQDISDELMQGNLPVDSVITRTTSDPDLTTTTVRTVVRRRIKKIVMIDGKPVEIEELEDPQDISDELMQGNLPVDSVITRTTSDPDLTTTTVRTVVRRRIKKIVMIDGKPVEIEELEDPQDISDELMQGNLPVDSVITRTTSDPDLTTTTVRTVVRRRIKKIVMVDGKPVETEEIVEEPEEVTDEIGEGAPREGISTEIITEPDEVTTTTVRRIIRRRVIKKIVMIDGKPVETEEVVEEPEEVSEEMLQTLPKDSVTMEAITGHKIIRRRIIKKIIMVDGKPVETEEVVEEPEEVTGEMIEAKPGESVITETITEPDEVTTTTVHRIIRRRIIKKIVMIDGKPVETEEVVEEPEEVIHHRLCMYNDPCIPYANRLELWCRIFLVTMFPGLNALEIRTLSLRDASGISAPLPAAPKCCFWDVNSIIVPHDEVENNLSSFGLPIWV